MNLKETREDFPLLRKNELIYLDNACMTLRPEQVWREMEKYYKEFPACHGRSTHKLSQKAEASMREARTEVKDFLGARKPEEIIFTKNTTEAINLVANSLQFEKDDRILTSDREHNSNLVPWQKLEKQKGIKHSIVESKKNYEFSIDNFKESISEDTKLVSMVHSSNLDGYTLPVKEIIEISHENDALVLLDGAQFAPHKPIDLRKLNPDFFAMSAHKLCGPSGMGCLYVKEKHLDRLEPFLVGGETVDNSWYDRAEFSAPPGKFEAGLQNVAGIIGFGKACEYLQDIGKENIVRHISQLNRILTEESQRIDKLQLVGVEDWEKRSGIFNFTITGKDPHEIGMLLDETENIAVRTGMHCLHSWFNSNDIEGSVRASFYFYNTEKEIRKFAKTLREIVNYLV